MTIMQLSKFYIIRTGRSDSDTGEEFWYETVKTEKLENGYLWSEFHPFEYPLFTTFEEADKACRSDWGGLMYECCDNLAKVQEYTMTDWGTWYISTEWVYSVDGMQYNSSSDVYGLCKIRKFSNDGDLVSEEQMTNK